MPLDPDEIRDYERRSFFEKDHSNSTTPLTIFLAVLAAILVSWAIREAYLEWQVRRALEYFNQQVEISNARSQQQLRAFQIQSQAAQAQAEEQAKQQAEAHTQQRLEEIRLQAEAHRQQRLEEIQLQRENQARIAEANAQLARKEEAWGQYYKPTAGCELDNPRRATVECGNDHIKAIKRFEQYWLTKHY